MFICTLELLNYILPEAEESVYVTVARLLFDPQLEKGDELAINMSELDEYAHYTGNFTSFRVKVINKEKVIYACDDSPLVNEVIKRFHLQEYSTDEIKKSGVMYLRVLLEAEDRDAVLKWSENIRRNNPHLSIKNEQ